MNTPMRRRLSPSRCMIKENGGRRGEEEGAEEGMKEEGRDEGRGGEGEEGGTRGEGGGGRGERMENGGAECNRKEVMNARGMSGAGATTREWRGKGKMLRGERAGRNDPARWQNDSKSLYRGIWGQCMRGSDTRPKGDPPNAIQQLAERTSHKHKSLRHEAGRNEKQGRQCRRRLETYAECDVYPPDDCDQRRII
ncbi:hypothetical protein DFH06DRAFT_1210116 [Mycena polygramma]|nr:hypothetical protein DFH06DRAFT_1210116 [Mycena polygramma]